MTKLELAQDIVRTLHNMPELPAKDHSEVKRLMKHARVNLEHFRKEQLSTTK